MRRYREYERIVPTALTCQHCGRTSEEIFTRRGGGVTAITDDSGRQTLVCQLCREGRPELFPNFAEMEAVDEA